MLTKDEIIQALPPAVQGGVSDTLVNELNAIITDPDFRETFRENMISYNRVLAEGKFKLSSYMNAVMHVSFYRDWETDRKSTRLNSSHSAKSRMPSSA